MDKVIAIFLKETRKLNTMIIIFEQPLSIVYPYTGQVIILKDKQSIAD